MSKYTTEVRYICENYAGLAESVDYGSVQDVLDKCRDKVFDFDFPLFDETYRNVLEDKILKHYYTREIGAETVGLWKLWLDTKLNEIMPYYNQLYKSALIEFNPMYDVDVTTIHQRVDNRNDNVSESELKVGNRDTSVHGEDKSDAADGGKNDHWEMFSDTPSGGLNGVRSETYLTTALHTTDDKAGSVYHNESSTDGSSEVDYDEDVTRNKQASVKNIQDYAEHVSGKTSGASYSKLLKEFRETFLNIDMMIIEELGDLFMTLW